MKVLLGYEIKKIIRKKSTIVAFVLLFVLQSFLAITGSLGSTYVDDVFVETHAERNRIDRENGIALSGRPIDDELLTEIVEAYGKIEGDEQYLLSEVYQTEVRPYSDLNDRIRAWGLRSALADKTLTENMLYEVRLEEHNAMWDYYGLSDKERQYWTEKEEELAKPFIYEYATAYNSLISMQGGYMTCMLLTFFIAISMVNVFTEEHGRKTDQLILCTRNGRGRLYLAKLLAGSIVVFTANLLFTLVAVVGKFFSYGAEGFHSTLQVGAMLGYSYELSMGETLLIMIGLLLSSVMVAIFTMVLAELLRNSVGAMAIVVGGLFAARLVIIPVSWGMVSQLWNYIPINLLKLDQGFTDLRLVSVFGLQMTTWQFAPILYVLLIVAFAFIGSRVYKGYQVSGR